MTFQVEAENLTAHASHLEALTDRVDTAIAAAQEVSMSDDAYGLLCSFLPPIINPMEQQGLDALKSAKEGITTTAENVRQTAKEYQETDQAGADNFSQFDDAVRVDEAAVAPRGVLPVGGPEGGAVASGPTAGAGVSVTVDNPSGGPVSVTVNGPGAGQPGPQGQSYASGQSYESSGASSGGQSYAPYSAPSQDRTYSAYSPSTGGATYASYSAPSQSQSYSASSSGVTAPPTTEDGEPIEGDVPTFEEFSG